MCNHESTESIQELMPTGDLRTEKGLGIYQDSRKLGSSYCSFLSDRSSFHTCIPKGGSRKLHVPSKLYFLAANCSHMRHQGAYRVGNRAKAQIAGTTSNNVPPGPTHNLIAFLRIEWDQNYAQNIERTASEGIEFPRNPSVAHGKSAYNQRPGPGNNINTGMSMKYRVFWLFGKCYPHGPSYARSISHRELSPSDREQPFKEAIESFQPFLEYHALVD